MEKEKKQETIIINTYSDAWNYEMKIYSFGDIVLPIAINISQMGYFAIGFVLCLFLTKIPFLSGLPSLLKFVVLPLAFTYFIAKYRKDGKNPLKWFIDVFLYFIRPKKTLRNKKCEVYGKFKF